MGYKAPLSDFHFIMDHVIDFEQITKTERFSHVTSDIIKPILSEGGKLAEQVLAPINHVGDQSPAYLENGVVRTSPGFAQAYRAIAQGGWVALSSGLDHGGMMLPLTLSSVVNEMFSSGCLSLQLNPLLTQGQIETLEHHASDAIKALYLPKLISGEWNGTMNLTEPQAGSDLGALRSKAESGPNDTYKITGQKIFITWGDGDFMENTIHLVLARLPDAPAGSRGISLFLVPKFIPDNQGNVGERNNLHVVSLEHKLGIHASPTCVMSFDNATGWLIGEPHTGLASMFTMMNNARLGVGIQGVGVAEAAYQHALDYALSRIQGKTPQGQANTIIGHADVRRMLATMKAEIFSARSIALSCATAIDMTNAHPQGDIHEKWSARAALLTPIAKAYGTDVSVSVASSGIQVFGGMGFIEESGAAQYLRDARITPIYEGTNGIQAMDLVGRKMMDDGKAAYQLIDEIDAQAKNAPNAVQDLAQDVSTAAKTLREATKTLLSKQINDRFAVSVPYLRAFALILGGHYHLKAAIHDKEGSTRKALARIMIKRVLPEYHALLAQLPLGADDLYALSSQDFKE